MSRSESGAVAVEFALMAVPLFSVLFVAVDLDANDRIFKQLDAAAYDIVKGLRDNTISASSYSLASARDELACTRLPGLACASLVVGLSPLSSTGRLTSAHVTAATWCAGGPQDGLLFQLAYPVPFLTRLWAGDLESRKPYYVTSFALRNSPGAFPQDC